MHDIYLFLMKILIKYIFIEVFLLANNILCLSLVQCPLTSQLLLLYYLLLYEDCRVTSSPPPAKGGAFAYSPSLFSQLPIRYLLSRAQRDQAMYAGESNKELFFVPQRYFTKSCHSLSHKDIFECIPVVDAVWIGKRSTYKIYQPYINHQKVNQHSIIFLKLCTCNLCPHSVYISTSVFAR